MSQKSKTPAGAGASCDSFAGLTPFHSSPLAIHAQFLMAPHYVRPELTEMLAKLAFGESAYHG